MPATVSLKHDIAPATLSSSGPGARNLNGQRLGRKGLVTRERLINAASELVLTEAIGDVTLSAVAKRASLGLTSIYAYFSDLTELLLAVLEPVMAEARSTLWPLLQNRWSDETLGEDCTRFVAAYLDIWAKHSRILHLRNSLADQGDLRMRIHRVSATRPIIEMMTGQMVGVGASLDNQAAAMASMLMTGIERAVTVATDESMQDIYGDGTGPRPARVLQPAAHLLELAIRDSRG